ncbi:MAG: Uma2 family endonuclease [Bryobacteraceae bacterium]
MASQPKHLLTAQQYLEIEADSTLKHEFYYGEMFDMAGGTVNHALIARNLLLAVSAKLAGTDCQAIPSDLRLCIDPASHFTYPDMMIICGEIQLLSGRNDTVVNPVAIFEVLSISTAAHDRGAKFHGYQRISTLREYFLLSQDEVLIEKFERQHEGKWLLSNHQGLNALVPVLSTRGEVALSDIYAGIRFPGAQ